MQSSDKFLDLLWSSAVCCIASVLFHHFRCDFLPFGCCVCVCGRGGFIIIVLRHRVHRHKRHSGTYSHTLAIWIILHFDFFLTLSLDPNKVYLYWRKHRFADEMMAAWDDDFHMQFIKPKCTHTQTDGPTVTYGIRFYGYINAPIQLYTYIYRM